MKPMTEQELAGLEKELTYGVLDCETCAHLIATIRFERDRADALALSLASIDGDYAEKIREIRAAVVEWDSDIEHAEKWARDSSDDVIVGSICDRARRFLAALDLPIPERKAE